MHARAGEGGEGGRECVGARMRRASSRTRHAERNRSKSRRVESSLESALVRRPQQTETLHGG